MPSLRLRSVTSLTRVHAEPREDAEQVTQALPGQPLAVEWEQGEWARVRTAYVYAGWVPAVALDGEAATDWLVERDGDPVEENGRILHATGREGVCAVVEEEHPPDLAARAGGTCASDREGAQRLSLTIPPPFEQ